MDRDKLNQRAFDYHSGGYHCAEAVGLAVIEECGLNPADLGLPRAASGFGGGVGETQEEMCGALAGGVLALGLILGRTEPGTDVRPAFAAAARLRELFLAEFGSTGCADLVRSFAAADSPNACRRLSGRTAALVGRVLDEQENE